MNPNIAKSLLSTSFVLEVERKFHSLAVQELTTHKGSPPFRSLRALGQRTISDTYYDRSNLLSSSGIWVRRRNERWEAKIRKAGNFTNSSFEELSDPLSISRCIREVTGINGMEKDNFGLDCTAGFTTTRESWMADDEFRIVLDTMDFGHTVGEVELERTTTFSDIESASVENCKLRVMRAMDQRIVEFMDRYAWAFSPGMPKGKLTAYFELKASLQEK
ncbi:CYTH-like domain-containing protein [Phaeosphaeriaceae sp. PMI808]|nr:CYTH-like domain-containing protein [Phaeosphaeriaceae sp. PMI808]